MSRHLKQYPPSVEPQPAQPFSIPPSPLGAGNRTTSSGPAIGGDRPRRHSLCQIERVEIGATAQDGFIRKLLDHQIGSVIDDLIDDRGRGLIDERLTRYEVARGLRIVADAHAGIRYRDALACRQFGRDRLVSRFAQGLYNECSSRRPHRPDAEIRTHGSLLASLESKPNPSPRQSNRRRLNEMLEMSVNAACIRARHIDSNFNGRERQSAAPRTGRN